MNPVGDAFTVGIVLLLLIGAVAFYLYTRLSQVEKRINLLENILLDLKVATENAFPGFPLPVSGGSKGSAAHEHEHLSEETSVEEEAELLSEYVPKLPTAAAKAEETEEEADETSMYEQALESALDSAVIGDAESVEADVELVGDESRPVEISADAGAAAPKSEVHVNKLNPNYAEMTVKELRTLAQNHGISGVGKMSRKEIIDALHKKDSGVVEGIESSSSSLGFESSLIGNAASIDA